MNTKKLLLLLAVSLVFVLGSCQTNGDRQVQEPLKLDSPIDIRSANGIGISREAIVKEASLKRMGFVFRRDRDIDGKANFVGYVKKIPATLQLIGRDENLDSVTVLAVLGSDVERNCLRLTPMISTAVAIDSESGNWVALELSNILMARNPFNKSYVEQKDFGKRRFEITVTDNIVMLTINAI